MAKKIGSEIRMSEEEFNALLAKATATPQTQAAPQQPAPEAAPAPQESTVEDYGVPENDSTLLQRGGIYLNGATARIGHGLNLTDGQTAYNAAHKAAKMVGYKSSRRPFAKAWCDVFHGGDAEEAYAAAHPFRTAWNEIFG